MSSSSLPDPVTGPLTNSPVTVVVPAAGQGTRMGAGPRKQLRLLGGAPVLVQTLRTFARHPEIAHLVVAAPEDERASIEAMLAEAADETPEVGRKLHAVVTGGATRQASVQRGTEAIPEVTEIVLVHDAVRPFVSEDEISRVIGAIRETGAAALAIPLADTLRRGGDNRFGATVPRDGLYRMQTPQGARLDWLRDAQDRFGTLPGTDEVELLRQAGYPVQIVEGSALNIKITRPADWRFALKIWH